MKRMFRVWMAAAAAAAVTAAYADSVSVSQAVLPAEGGPVTVQLVRDAKAEKPEAMVMEGDETGYPVRLDLAGKDGGSETWSGTAILPSNDLDFPITCSIKVAGLSKDVTILPRGWKSTGNGLRATYYFDDKFTSMMTSRQESIPQVQGSMGVPQQLTGKAFSAVWEGLLTAEFTGEAVFHVKTGNNARLLVDGQQVVSRSLRASEPESEGRYALVAGRKYMFRLEYVCRKGSPELGVFWTQAGQPKQVIPQRQFSTLDKVRPAPSMTASVPTGKQKISYQGGKATLDAVFASRLGEVKAWAEVTSPGEDVVRLPLGSTLDLPKNDDVHVQSYKVEYVAVDASGYMARMAGPEYVVMTEKSPEPEPNYTPAPAPYQPAPRKKGAGQVGGDPRPQQNSDFPVWEGPTSALVQRAMEYRGLRYVWGGNSLVTGTDCSGFIQNVFRQFGRRLPRTAREQAKVGMPVDKSNLQPGDRLYFVGGRRPGITHTGLYIGGGQMVHANQSQMMVSVSDLNSRYFQKNFACARR